LVLRASEHGVGVLALTDHDTDAGVSRAMECATPLAMTVISGIEFSTQWLKRSIHIVGLNFDLQSPAIRQAIATQETVREERAMMIGERLQRAGVADAYKAAKGYAGDGAIGRPHFAQHLVASGTVRNTSQAFKRFLGAGKPGDVKHHWPAMADAVAWIRAAGGIAVLAHPAKYKLTRTKLCLLAGDFKEAGGQAMEVISGRQVTGLAQNLVKIAEKYQLAGSCGSDFHRAGQPWQELGQFEPLPAGIQPVWELW